uniref:SSD domain-containing protein n=4 Tax=Ostreococcus mediterraneus TaxID=1486918 RepID=A0A7S0KEQ6_9CHLO
MVTTSTSSSTSSRASAASNCVLTAITRWPCATCGAALACAFALGGIGYAVAGLEINTEGWETRGTVIANAYAPLGVYRESSTNAGEPRDRRRRARRRLLARGDQPVEDCDCDSDSDCDSAKRRSLLQSTASTTCAVQDGSDTTFMSSSENLNVIFAAKAGVDLLSPNAMADACEFFEDAIMAASGYSMYCARDDSCTLPLPTGENTGEAWKWWGLNSATSPNAFNADDYARCQRAYSYATYFYSSKGYTSCNDYRTNSALQASLATAKASLVACATGKAADDNFVCSTDASLPYSTAALDTFFGVGGVDNLSYTRGYLPNKNKWSGGVNFWKGVSESGSASSSSEYFTVAWDFDDNSVREQVVDEKLIEDMALAASAIVVILVLMWLHTGSVLLTLGGVVQIIMAFPSALFLTGALCGISFFPFLNFIGVFVIAGIGADDCFVMYDKWMMAKCRCLPGANSRTVAERCYWDSCWAMLLTSLTTSAAFFSNAITPIAPIRVFALFMGGMVLFDYLYDITIFAALLAWQHDRVIKHDISGKNSVGSWVLDFWGSIRRHRANKNAAAAGKPAVKEGDVIDSKRDTRSIEERILGEKVFPIVNKIRWPLVLVLCGIFSGGMYGALQLDTPSDSEVQLLPDSNMLTKFSYYTRSVFKSSAESQVWVDVVWGVKAVDNGDQLDPDSKTTIEYDTSLDLTSAEAQNWLKTFCTDTQSNMAYENGMNCWMTAFDSWLGVQNALIATSGQVTDFTTHCLTSAGANAAALPIAPGSFYECLYLFATATSYYNAQQPLTLGFYYDSSGTRKLKIIGFQFGTDVLWTAPVGNLETSYKAWEAYVTEQMAGAPDGLKNGYQASEAWLWMDTVTAMRDGAYVAAATTLGISAVTTLVSTQNIVIMLYSIFAILTILVVVVSSIVSLGWTLGFLEGICLVILIGLSVDYVIHIGHAYAHAARQSGATREESARHAIATMGFPVLSAAFTTLIAALFLLNATIVFFTKFGIVTVLSSIYSSFVSVVLFVALLAAAGPTNGFGDFSRLFSKKRLEKSASLY